jgi:hypothetical protein
VRIELLFDQSTSCNLEISRWRMAAFHSNDQATRLKEPICLDRKTTLLEAGASSTLFSSENWVSFERNSSATRLFQGGGRVSLHQIGLFSWVEGSHLSVERKTSVLEREGSSSLFPLEIDFVLNLIVPANYVLHGADRLCLFHTVQFRCVEVTRASLKRKPSVLEGRGSGPLLSWEFWVSFWKK